MDPRKTKKNAPPPPGEHWGVDPQDVRRHAQRMREARAVGPLDKIFRGAAVALVLVIAFAVYWNFDALSNLSFDLSKVTGAFDDAAEEVEDARRGEEPGNEVVGDTSVAGVNMPTSIKGDEPEADAPAVSADAPMRRLRARNRRRPKLWPRTKHPRLRHRRPSPRHRLVPRRSASALKS